MTRIRTHLPNGAIAQTESVVVERVRDQRIVVLSTTSPFGFAPTRRWRFGSIATRAERTLEAHPDGTLLVVASESRITPAVLRLYFTFVSAASGSAPPTTGCSACVRRSPRPATERRRAARVSPPPPRCSNR